MKMEPPLPIMAAIENGYRHEKAAVMRTYFDIKGDYSGVKMRPDYLDRVQSLPTFNRATRSNSDTSSRTSGMYQVSNSTGSMPHLGMNSTGYNPFSKVATRLYDEDEEERRRAYSF